MNQIDLFAGTPRPAERSPIPDVGAIRSRLLEALETVRSADRMPWEPPLLRSWQIVFVNMSKWLPADERDRLRHEFEVEISRLTSCEADLE